MKQIYLLVFLTFLCSTAHTKPIQSEANLLKELPGLTPLKRILRSSKHLDSMLTNGTPLPEVKQRIDKLILYADQIPDNELSGYLVFYDKIKKGLISADDEEKIAEFKSALSYFEDKGNHKYAGAAQYYLGQHYYDRREYGHAFYHHAKAQELFDKVGMRNIVDIGKYLHIMALNNYYFGYYDKVIKLMQASITLPAFNDNLGIQRYNTLGASYQHLGQLDSAIFYFSRTHEVAASLRDTTWMKIASGNLGSVYLKQKKYLEALPLLMQDYRHNRLSHFVLARNAAVNIASAWQKLNNQDSTLYYLLESRRLNDTALQHEEMWKNERNEQFQTTYYEVFHEYHKKRGNTNMAYHYLDSLTQLQSESNHRYNKMTAQVAEDRVRIEQQLSALALQEAEKNRISIRFRFIVGMIALLTAVMALLYNTVRLKRAKENLSAEKEKIKLKAARNQTEAKLFEANLELKEYMLRLQEKNKLVEMFQSKINQLSATPTDAQSLLFDELASGLADTKLLTTEDWNDFRQRFNRAFNGQLDHLRMQHGDITSAEERIYALDKMNVATNQMAWMLGISPESVRKTRYRLRKKIGTVEV